MKLLEVDPPATLAGCISIVHTIDAASALGDCLDTPLADGRLSIKEEVLATMSVCVTIVAGDTTYQSDVTGTILGQTCPGRRDFMLAETLVNKGRQNTKTRNPNHAGIPFVGNNFRFLARIVTRQGRQNCWGVEVINHDNQSVR